MFSIAGEGSPRVGWAGQGLQGRAGGSLCCDSLWLKCSACMRLSFLLLLPGFFFFFLLPHRRPPHGHPTLVRRISTASERMSCSNPIYMQTPCLSRSLREEPKWPWIVSDLFKGSGQELTASWRYRSFHGAPVGTNPYFTRYCRPGLLILRRGARAFILPTQFKFVIALIPGTWLFFSLSLTFSVSLYPSLSLVLSRRRDTYTEMKEKGMWIKD